MAKRKRQKRKYNWIYNLIIIVCVCVAVFAAYNLIKIQLEYKAGRDEYDKLREYTTVRDSETANAGTATPTVSPSDRSPSTTEEPEEGPYISEAPIEVNHAALKNICDDYVGWLYFGELDISYPLVLGPDDDYYLRRSLEGEYLMAGTLFLESLNSGDFSDAHTIIFGHNLNDSSMFSTFTTLLSKGTINNRYFWILTPEKNYKYKIFSAQVVRYDSNIYTVFSDSSELFLEYIDEWAATSDVSGLDMDGAIEPPRVVTLSTCYGPGVEGNRCVIHGILVYEEDVE